jgi:hypothetical protein
MPFNLSIDGRLANGDEVRLSQGSYCSPGVLAGGVRYFADRFGVPRAAMEGTNIPFDLIRRNAKASPAGVVHRRNRRGDGLFLERSLEYAGFSLDRVREELPEPFPAEWRGLVAEALAEAALGEAGHPSGPRLRQLAAQVDEYWRRSGGTLASAAHSHLVRTLAQHLGGAETWKQFLSTRLALHIDDLVPAEVRAPLDALPDEVGIAHGRVRLRYEVEDGRPVVWAILKDAQVKRLRAGDVPRLDRPMRFVVQEKGGRRVQADTVEDLRRLLNDRSRRGRFRRR